MSEPKRYLIHLKDRSMVGSGSVEASNWTEALSKAILKASVDQVELTGIELVQEPVVAQIPMQRCQACPTNFRPSAENLFLCPTCREKYRPRPIGKGGVGPKETKICDTCGQTFETIYQDRTTCRECVVNNKPTPKQEPEPVDAEIPLQNPIPPTLQTFRFRFQTHAGIYELRDNYQDWGTALDKACLIVLSVGHPLLSIEAIEDAPPTAGFVKVKEPEPKPESAPDVHQQILKELKNVNFNLIDIDAKLRSIDDIQRAYAKPQ